MTGGRSGIGRAIVERLESDGAEVQVLDLVDGFDVGDTAAWESVGPVELACLNAGIGTGAGDVGMLADEAYRRVLRTNVDGVVLGVRHLSRVMADGGAIVVTASLAGLTTMVSDPIYSGTKHFVVGFVRSVAPQLAKRGVRINAVCPAVVDTPMLGALRERVLEAGMELIRPEEIAEAVVASARGGSTGEAWACLPGKPPERVVFRRFFESA